MTRLLLKPVLAIIVASLFYAIPAGAQETPTTKKAKRVKISQGPEIERVDPDFAIIRWTSNNPGGGPEHHAVVHYGTDRAHLDQTAESPIRLNPDHTETIFRVRVPGLKPQTTYYYTVSSVESSGTPDNVKSPIKQFTTPDAAPAAGASN